MITKQMILDAQKLWGDGIVAIGKAKTDGGNYVAAAQMHLDNLYAYDLGPVLFKPTKASQLQFRGDIVSALSYFVGENPKYPEDHGFALQPWTAVRFENAGFVEGEEQALAMGNYFFTTTSGEEVKVEYSFGYVTDSQGNLKINLHHSSLPYNPGH